MKNLQAIRKNRTAFTALLFVTLPFWSSVSMADCDAPNNPPSGSIVTCSGVTDTPYVVTGQQNVRVTNTGTWTGVGDTYLMRFVGPDLTGAELINEGTMEWTNAALTAGQGARGPLWMFTTNNTATSGLAINAAIGTILVEVDNPPANDVGGMIVQTRGPDGSMTAENLGEILIVGNADSGSALHGMIVRANSVLTVVNDGLIDVQQTEFTSQIGHGVRPIILQDSTIPVASSMSNTGIIRVAEGNENLRIAFGIRTQQVSPTAGQPGTYSVENTGLVEAWAREAAYGVVSTGNFPENSISFVNSGQVLTHSSGSTFAFFASAADVPVSITNSGEMVGDIVTRNGDDFMLMEGGTIDGDIFMEPGSDHFIFIDGVVNGIIDGGDSASSADGWVDVFDFDGYQGTSPEITNWEQINVTNSAQVTFVFDILTETFTIDNNGVARLADNLVLTGDVANNGTIDLQSPDANSSATIVGDLTGDGLLDLSVNPGSDIADVLFVFGDTSGSSITIRPAPINFIPGTGNDILVVSVNGVTADGHFTLPNGSTSQVINNVLYQLNLIENEWFLTTQNIAPAVAVPAGNLTTWILLMALMSLGGIGAVRRRIG